MNRRLRVVEDVPLSASRSDRRVTVLQCRERTPKRVKKPERQWTWITDLPVTRAEAPATARMARSRWKIENETFNTLKNQGYGLEHNYGHGHQYVPCEYAGDPDDADVSDGPNPAVVLPALPSRPTSAEQLRIPVGKDARCDLAPDPPQLGTVVRSPRWCRTRPQFRTTRS